MVSLEFKPQKTHTMMISVLCKIEISTVACTWPCFTRAYGWYRWLERLVRMAGILPSECYWRKTEAKRHILLECFRVDVFHRSHWSNFVCTWWPAPSSLFVHDERRLRVCFVRYRRQKWDSLDQRSVHRNADKVSMDLWMGLRACTVPLSARACADRAGMRRTHEFTDFRRS